MSNFPYPPISFFLAFPGRRSPPLAFWSPPSFEAILLPASKKAHKNGFLRHTTLLYPPVLGVTPLFFGCTPQPANPPLRTVRNHHHKPSQTHMIVGDSSPLCLYPLLQLFPPLKRFSFLSFPRRKLLHLLTHSSSPSKFLRIHCPWYLMQSLFDEPSSYLFHTITITPRGRRPLLVRQI